MANGHAYSLLAAFTMTKADSSTVDMVMLRNPWGIAKYDKEWSYNDPNWTPELVAQVPLGFDPTVD